MMTQKQQPYRCGTGRCGFNNNSGGCCGGLSFVIVVVVAAEPGAAVAIDGEAFPFILSRQFSERSCTIGICTICTYVRRNHWGTYVCMYACRLCRHMIHTYLYIIWTPPLTGDVPPPSDVGRRQAARGGETARRPWTVDGGRSPLTLYIN